MVAHVIKWVRAELRRKPETRFLQISPNDGPAHCKTPSEARVNAEEGTEAGAFFRAINEIAAAISPEHPDTKIVSLAYSWTQRPPQALASSKLPKLHPAVVVYFAPIGDNFAIPHVVPSTSPVHQFAAPEYNRMTTADLARWKELIAPRNMWIWDYVTDFSGYMHPFPNYHVLGQNVRDLAAIGATHYYAEGESDSDGGELAELKAFLLSKLIWDPTLNETELIGTFLTGYYGAAAQHLREYMQALTDAVAPTTPERRFVRGSRVRVATRPWAAGGRGVVTNAHSDGTYDVNLTEANGFPTHPHVVSWAYLKRDQEVGGGHATEPASEPGSAQPTDVYGSALPRRNGTLVVDIADGYGSALPRSNGTLVVDMVAESCDVPQNGSHNGWACGYLTPHTTLRALRAQLAAAATPGLTAAQAARVRRSALPSYYVALVKWEELRAWVAQHPELEGDWPLPEAKEAVFEQFVGSLKAFKGITKVAGESGAPWTETWLRDRIFFGNVSTMKRG
uniref:Uncharacterized protein n=1 Tax=Haptolina brevifila TaxID=156173 RepID=A0A7S2FVV3_9EUKA|mmetsp:Transcript_21245/g.42997  ORF Transcript_21245/g.42997 Transcript_21245/m.42997 type:complete len:508 (+) Transcript_21245:2-1525(+)